MQLFSIINSMTILSVINLPFQSIRRQIIFVNHIFSSFLRAVTWCSNSSGKSHRHASFHSHFCLWRILQLQATQVLIFCCRWHGFWFGSLCGLWPTETAATIRSQRWGWGSGCCIKAWARLVAGCSQGAGALWNAALGPPVHLPVSRPKAPSASHCALLYEHHCQAVNTAGPLTAG